MTRSGEVGWRKPVHPPIHLQDVPEHLVSPPVSPKFDGRLSSLVIAHINHSED